MRKRLEGIAKGRGEWAGLCLRGIHKLDMRRVLAKLSNLNRNKI